MSVGSVEDTRHYEVCRICVEELALYLKPISGGKGECKESDTGRSATQYASAALLFRLAADELMFERRNISCCSVGTCALSVCGWRSLRQCEKQKSTETQRPLQNLEKNMQVVYMQYIH